MCTTFLNNHYRFIFFFIYILISQTEWFQAQEQNAAVHDRELSERLLAVEKARKREVVIGTKKLAAFFVNQDNEETKVEEEETIISCKDFSLKRSTLVQRINKLNKATRFHPTAKDREREKRSKETKNNVSESNPSLTKNCLHQLKELHDIAANIHILQSEPVQITMNQTSSADGTAVREFPSVGRSSKFHLKGTQDSKDVEPKKEKPTTPRLHDNDEKLEKQKPVMEFSNEDDEFCLPRESETFYRKEDSFEPAVDIQAQQQSSSHGHKSDSTQELHDSESDFTLEENKDDQTPIKVNANVFLTDIDNIISAIHEMPDHALDFDEIIEHGNGTQGSHVNANSQ